MPVYKIDFPQGIRKIRIVKLSEFHDIVSKFPQKGFVDKPWTVNEIVRGKQVYSDGINDCTSACFSEMQNQEAILSHVKSSEDDYYQKCMDFNPIEAVIKEKMNVKPCDSLAFLFGSDSYYKDSKKHFNHFLSFVKREKIPFSMMRGHNLSDYSKIAYDGNKKELLVSNLYITNQLDNKRKSLGMILLEAFDQIKLTPQHKLFRENELYEEVLPTEGLETINHLI